MPEDRKDAKSDEWVRVEGDIATVGISDDAQDSLSDIVYVNLPDVGAAFTTGQTFGGVESVKAQSDVYLPIAGVITEINVALSQNLEVLNQDPYGQGWLVRLKITDPSALAGLMDAAAYQAYCETRAH